jgi:uncharacterized membrane protein YphA (DoxX/SURF4 family)
MLQFRDPPMVTPIAPQAMEAVLAILIMIGLWTPIAGTLIAVVEVWSTFVCPGNPGTAILLATLGTTLAMIGPGAFSVDARLFGRKHFGS